MKNRTAVLCVNIGTPDSHKVSDVRKYLFEFLNDPRVMDIPKLLRWFLVNVIIVPFRARKSALIYKQLWTDKGSPLMLHGQDLVQKLQQQLNNNADVYLAMRYQKPSIPFVLNQIKKKNYNKIIVLPLYPQYASSTSGSTIQKIMEHTALWYVIPEITIISQYYLNTGYLNAFAEIGREHLKQEYDHILFSYHGLPTRQVTAVHQNGNCTNNYCKDRITEENIFCYQAACYETTRQIAARLKISTNQYSIAFQSRLDKNWLEPFSDKVVADLAKNGIKRLLVFSPAFTSDCLETIVEIGIEYKEIFEKYGGEHLQLVESLNTHPLWLKALEEMIQERL